MPSLLTAFRVVVLAFSTFWATSCFTVSRAARRLSVSVAPKYRPPPESARQVSCSFCSSFTSNPTTCSTNLMSNFFNDFTTPHGSAWQVSSPSLIKTIMVSASTPFNRSATIFMESAIGVFPLGVIAFNWASNASLSASPGLTNTSMSEQSPFFLWP